jgi:hypothetical protein
MPEGDDLRKAVKWISEERNENTDKKISDLVDDAALRFDLSPKESETLMRLLKKQ